VRDEDTVARHDDTHLVVVLPAIPEARHAARVTREVIHALDPVIEVDGQPLSLGVNVGLSFFPTDGADPETLIKHAASAMGRSRRRGRNSYELYTPDMHQAAVRRIHLEASLRRAVEREEMTLHFQPVFDLKTGRAAGVEALVRWNGPDGSPVTPGEFIPIAEETGLIVPLGAWILRAACLQMTRWHRAGLAPGRLAVNVSARQLEGDVLPETVRAVLAETGLPAADLELEITESALVRNAEEAVKTLERVREMGVSLAVDDFGTGHAALAYLRRFPIDTLKIDRTFVAPCAGDPEDAAIIQALIQMAHSLRLRVVAEGIETEAQLAFLKSHGCDQGQGFLLARPGPPEVVAGLLGARGESRTEGA
jgi:EAL domain-containing protein (putative c-di-GMP-specific phosphodiesterase class I)